MTFHGNIADPTAHVFAIQTLIRKLVQDSAESTRDTVIVLWLLFKILYNFYHLIFAKPLRKTTSTSKSPLVSVQRWGVKNFTDSCTLNRSVKTSVIFSPLILPLKNLFNVSHAETCNLCSCSSPANRHFLGSVTDRDSCVISGHFQRGLRPSSIARKLPFFTVKFVSPLR